MSVPSSTPQFSGIAVMRPHRADARRNFDALLAAARDAFNRDGIDVPLEDIARQAGVGIGTLYRNFPTRSDLVEAVYVSEIEELLQAARDANEREPWDALEMWLRRFSGYVATKLAMLQGLNKDSEMFRACRAAMYDDSEPALRARPGGRRGTHGHEPRRRHAARIRRDRIPLRERRAARTRPHPRARRHSHPTGRPLVPIRTPAVSRSERAAFVMTSATADGCVTSDTNGAQRQGRRAPFVIHAAVAAVTRTT